MAAYLKNTSAWPAGQGAAALFNASGRAYPDLAANANQCWIKENGEDAAQDGTSCATPVVAGLVALINAHRLRHNRTVVGFLNPLLYAVWADTKGAVFNDVVEAGNRCSEMGCQCKTGFNAAPGWDATTGLGTPNLGRLIEAIDALDERREAAIAPAAQGHN